MSFLGNIWVTITLFFGSVFGGLFGMPNATPSLSTPPIVGTSTALQENTAGTVYDLTLTTKGELKYSAGVTLRVDSATYTKLDNWYWADKNSVYSVGGQTKIPQRMTYADRGTFDILPNGTHSEWAKDKHYVYDYGRVVSGADPQFFVVLSPDHSYATDGKTLFYSTASEYFGVYQSFSNVDTPSLQVFDDGYAKDKSHVFFEANTLDGVDPTSVSFLSQTYIKDKKAVYFVNTFLINTDTSDRNPIPQLVEVVRGADPATFIVAHDVDYDAQDKYHTYKKGRVIE